MCGVVDLQEMERGKLWGGGEEKEIPDLQSLALSTSAEEPLSDSHLSPESHHDWRRRACVLGARVVINPPPHSKPTCLLLAQNSLLEWQPAAACTWSFEPQP